MLTYKSYQGSVQYNSAENVYYGFIQNIEPYCMYFEGKDRQELEKNFQNAVEDYLKLKGSNC